MAGPVKIRANCANDKTAPISAPLSARSTSSQRGRNTRMTPVVPNNADITIVTRAAREAKRLADSSLIIDSPPPWGRGRGGGRSREQPSMGWTPGEGDDWRKNNARAHARAKRLRAEETPSEKQLWRVLRTLKHD